MELNYWLLQPGLFSWALWWVAFTVRAGCCGSEASASRRPHRWSQGCSPDELNSGHLEQIVVCFFLKRKFLISECFFFVFLFLPKFWFDVTYYKSTVEIPVWSLSFALTLNPSDYKGRYSLSKLQKTDGGNEKTTHTPMRGRELCVDTRWMRGISYLERSSVSSGPSHQDWTLLKACSLASELQKQLQKSHKKQHNICIKLILLRQLCLKWDSLHVCTKIDTKAHTQTCTVSEHEFRITPCCSQLLKCVSFARATRHPTKHVSRSFCQCKSRHTHFLSLSLVTIHLHI